MNLLKPKTRLVKSDDPEHSWVVLTEKGAARKRSRFLAMIVALAGGVFVLVAYGLWQNAAELPPAAVLTASVADTTQPTALPVTIPGQPEPPETRVTQEETVVAPTINPLPFLKNNPRIRIEKIGVDMSVVEGQNENVLFRGAWRSPWSSTPEQGGNTVLFGHRYLHLPPHPETFFSLDKLTIGDTFEVFWNGKTYTYSITETFIVPPEDVSVLKQTERPVVTLITCTPIFATKNRLIVRGELIGA